MRYSKATFLLLSSAVTIAAFAPPQYQYQHQYQSQSQHQNHQRVPLLKNKVVTRTFRLCSNSNSNDNDNKNDQDLVAITLDDTEWISVKDLYQQVTQNTPMLDEVIANALLNMSPRLVVKLRQSEHSTDPALQVVATALRNVLDSKLAKGRAVLAELLEAGEIRKLDAAIGKAARTGALDMAFFTVLNMNISDAAAKESSQPAAGEIFVPDQQANQVQILQHIHTRCQEEVEKSVPPGVALLNKLLRTNVDTIRANQLQHYLCPQPNIITTPDGLVIPLEGIQPVLVSPMLLVDALAQAVKQIRTVERAGGVERVSAASLVESCRQVAKEARSVIGKEYGISSDVLRHFEEGLQPVFRPDSPQSPYIQGEQ